MRLRAVFLLAVAALLCDAALTRLAADPPRSLLSAVGVIIPVPAGDTNCPSATHTLRFCPDLPSSLYLAFDKGKGRVNNQRGYVTVSGEADLEACPPYTLLHVKRIAFNDTPPPPCPPPPCEPPGCTPGL
jgi:hypothetical protein